MHLKKVTLQPDQFPNRSHYPFNQRVFYRTPYIEFNTPVTFLSGENGTGKSTLLEALAHRCQIHIWRETERTRFDHNPYEKTLYKYLSLEWQNGFVPGSYFSSEIFRDFSAFLDEWAANDPEMLRYFGGKSLITQSHGQSLLSFFKARYKVRGLHLMDEPESALSPKSQLDLLETLHDMGQAGHAQFVIATHSPILLACPGATIYSFDHIPVKTVEYEDTDYFKIYRDFMINRERYLGKDRGFERPRDQGFE